MRVITMPDIIDINQGKPIELTPKQMQKIDKSLDEKDELIVKRFDNKAELERLKAISVSEHDKVKMYNSIEAGKDIIARQTKRISALSIAAIARRLKLPYERVEYYSNKQKYVS